MGCQHRTPAPRPPIRDSRMSVNSRFRWQPTMAGEVLVCEPLHAIAPHAFTTRDFGPATSAPDLDRAYASIAAHLGVPRDAVRHVRQVHGTAVHMAVPTENSAGVDADLLITAAPALAVVVRTADCAPILLADRRTGAVAAVHAGWRGTAAGAVGVAVRALGSTYGVAPGDLVAAIGPAIGACCYQVGDEVRQTFIAGHGPHAERWFTSDGDRWRLDIWTSNRDQLVAAGLTPGDVHVAGHCTATRLDRYYSFRVEGPAAGRQFAAITPRR